MSESVQPTVVVNPPLRSHLMQTRLQNNIEKPMQYHDGYVRYSLPKALMATGDLSMVELTSYTHASKLVELRQAMNTEFTTLIKNDT